ncbi:Ger(x)C family spore germination protein [Paenibacillus eucommiae]|uniref:Ger(X)C family germination protein n=1 Tax=Paenibacillus eucommiae TaxID=1355755 RepID=A0ABS4IWD1_9BACL|nr:Ger(x)C family spore germination protein [Paenibacillus eucommiae]MBP1991902.1 Ger(x)C family germination protein [Paenibacillus eucommiae]
MAPKRFALLLSIIVLALQTGCWDAKEIQNINYVAALGLDFKDGKYLAYIQIMDFSYIAKTDAGNPGEKASVWVGKGTGRTINEAINEIYRSSQRQVFWGHVTSIVFSESILKSGIQEVMDLTNRYREIRYTKWVYGTREPMEKILAATPFFKLSPLSSILHAPLENYRQNSLIKPLQFYRFTSNFHGLGSTVHLPSLGLENHTWKENDKDSQLLKIGGAFLIHSEKLKGWLPAASLEGARWVQPDAIRNPLTITSNDKKLIATLVLDKPQSQISFQKKSDQVQFQLHIQINATVNELIQPASESELVTRAAELIEEEVRAVYSEGLSIQSDILNLGEALYRKRPKLWRESWEHDQFPLNEQSLEKVMVEVHLINSGKYKLKK